MVSLASRGLETGGSSYPDSLHQNSHILISEICLHVKKFDFRRVNVWDYIFKPGTVQQTPLVTVDRLYDLWE